MKCFKCKVGKLAPVEAPHRMDVAGHTFTGKVAALKCGKCGEVALDGVALERFEMLAARRLADAGAATAEAFKFMRKAAGLRGTELAALLDVAGETVSRWETGALPVERRAVALLGAIVVEAADGGAATITRLRALQAPVALPKVIKMRAERERAAS